MAVSVNAFHRTRLRQGRLPLATKLCQALGALPGACKDFAFNTFLLLFYNQVLGLPATLTSIALMLALVVDAVTDPVVGSYSDGLKTRWGRRHPLMYGAIVPLALALYLVFTPPSGLGQTGLFVWLLMTTIATRVAMTFFGLPWAALFPELSDDYAERSEVLTYRVLAGAIGGALFTWCTWSFVFAGGGRETPEHLQQEGYTLFALVLALAVVITGLASALLTHREIPFLNQPVEQRDFSVAGVFRDVLSAFTNRDFAVLFVGLLISSVITGTMAALEIYTKTYFWGLSPEDLRWFALGGMGLLLAFASIPWLQARFDKKHLLIGSMLFSLFNGITFVGLRLLDVLPANGEPLLVRILLVDSVLSVWSGSITLVMFISMVADTLDAQELSTGSRQEGVFTAAISFSTKAISGLGIFAAGLILDFAVVLPRDVAPNAVAQDVLVQYGLVAGICVPLLYLVPFWVATRYRLTRARCLEISAALEQRRAPGGAAAPVVQDAI